MTCIFLQGFEKKVSMHFVGWVYLFPRGFFYVWSYIFILCTLWIELCGSRNNCISISSVKKKLYKETGKLNGPLSSLQILFAKVKGNLWINLVNYFFYTVSPSFRLYGQNPREILKRKICLIDSAVLWMSEWNRVSFFDAQTSANNTAYYTESCETEQLSWTLLKSFMEAMMLKKCYSWSTWVNVHIGFFLLKRIKFLFESCTTIYFLRICKIIVVKWYRDSKAVWFSIKDWKSFYSSDLWQRLGKFREKLTQLTGGFLCILL